MLNNTKSLSFDDVLITPRYSQIRSRSSVDTSTSIGLDKSLIKLSVPVVSSPMDTVTGPKMASIIKQHGGLGVLHRYNTIEEQLLMVAETLEDMEQISISPYLSAAIGVSGDYKERASELYKAGVKCFCVDVAHGHHILVKEALAFLREEFDDSLHIMAGNIATLEAFNDLSDWGANSIRVGIGGGSICSTRMVTGHGVPTLQSIIDCSKSDRNASLIADGGIRTSGDIVKALAFGANAVMLGSMLAGTNESPGKVINTGWEGKPVKTYRGMASVDAQIDWRGHTSSVEGVSSTVPCKGPLWNVLRSISNGISSGLSYSGCRSIKELQLKARATVITSSGLAESKTHING